MSRADGGLLVVRAGKTRYSAVDKLLEQMPKERLLGVVLNRTEEQPDPSSYYYQHRYYNRERRTTEVQPLPPNERLEEEVATVN
jgi:Mrp family chromosome partitioning ATPase